MASFPETLRAAALRSVAADAATGALVLVVLAGLALLALRERIRTEVAVAATAALIAADLLRAGAGLNPTAPASLYTLSPEMTVVAARLRQSGGRVFTCVVQAMPTFREAARRMRYAGAWSTGVWRESLSPYANVAAEVDTTGADATALVAARFSMTTGEVACQDPGTLERLRASGVRYVLSVQPFNNDALRQVDVASPARTAPLSIYVYELAGSLPDPAVWLDPDDVDELGRVRALEGATARYVEARPGLVRVAVEAPREAQLILRRTNAPGWSATVDGKDALITKANDRHQAVAVPQGGSEVVLRYRAPRAGIGVAASLLSLALAAGLYIRGRPAVTAVPAA